MNKAFVIGTGTTAIYCARTLVRNGFGVSVVEFENANVSPLALLCEKENLPFFNLKKDEITQKLMSIADNCLVISAGNNYLFPSKVVNRKNLTIINYHNALLPKYAGRNAEAWVIFMQENETGITWHYVNDTIDGGDIICQKTIPLSKHITSLKLLREQNTMAASAFDEILPFIVAKKRGIPQAPIDPSNMYYSKNIPGNGILNIEWCSDKIYAFLRAMDYGPLNILGIPRITIKGIHYTWRKYEINSKECCSAKNQASIKNNTITIMCANAELLLKEISV